MKPFTTILFIAGVSFSSTLYSQDISEFKKSEKKSTEAKPKEKEKPKRPPARKQSVEIVSKNDSVSNLIDVSISSTEDCYLYIDDDSLGIVYKTRLRKVKLPAGVYRVYAASLFTDDVFEINMSVSAVEVNTIQIPLRAIIDDRLKDEKEKRDVDERNKADQQKKQQEWQKEQQRIKDEDDKRKELVRQKEEEQRKYLARPDVKAMNQLASMVVHVDGGSISMGNSSGANDESYEHYVSVGSFYIGKYEVSQDQWQSIMGSNPSSFKNCGNCPVENITWEEVQLFINKLNAISNKRFRLPTEAEWEYMANRSITSDKTYKRISWYYDNSKGKTHPVGSLEPNSHGIYDLFGNVSEWCSDWYDGSYYKNSSRDNPAGPSSGKSKVVRGGSFYDMEGIFRPSRRDKESPSSRSKLIGFRLVLENN